MSGHTPGSWDWRSPLDGRRVVFVVKAGTSRDIAELPSDGAARFPDELSANARLIAAAPELLDACRFAVSQLHNLPRTATADAMEALLSAAIRKATGDVSGPCVECGEVSP